MSRPEIRELASALRRSVQHEHARRGTGRYEGTVLSVDPLRVDVHGLDDDLTDDDITIGNVLQAHLDDTPLQEDDTLMLVETEPGDYLALEVIRDA